jgi:hypothetical protein
MTVFFFFFFSVPQENAGTGPQTVCFHTLSNKLFPVILLLNDTESEAWQLMLNKPKLNSFILHNAEVCLQQTTLRLHVTF